MRTGSGLEKMVVNCGNKNETNVLHFAGSIYSEILAKFTNAAFTLNTFFIFEKLKRSIKNCNLHRF